MFGSLTESIQSRRRYLLVYYNAQ